MSHETSVVRPLLAPRALMQRKGRAIITRATESILPQLLLMSFILSLFTKQLLINLAYGNRHLISGILEVATFLALTLAAVAVTGRLVNDFHWGIPVGAIIATQTLLLAWWTLIFFVSPGGTFEQRITSLGYDALFSVLIWLPIISLTSHQSITNVERLLMLLLALVGLMAIAQWFVPDAFLPSLLRSDQTVALSGTAFGTTRVNGLIGDSIAFSFVACLAAGLFYVRLPMRIFSWVLVGLAISIVGVLFAGSRAAWVTAAVGLMFLTRWQRWWAVVPVSAVLFVAVNAILPAGYLTAPLDQPAVYVNSNTDHLFAIGQSIDALSASPIIGTGIGFQTAPDFGGEVSNKVVTDGFWWAVALEGGIPGLVFLWGTWTAIAALFISRLRSGSSDIWGTSLLGLFILGVGISEGFVNSAMDTQTVSIVFYLLIGLMMARLNCASKSKPATATPG